MESIKFIKYRLFFPNLGLFSPVNNITVHLMLISMGFFKSDFHVTIVVVDLIISAIILPSLFCVLLNSSASFLFYFPCLKFN